MHVKLVTVLLTQFLLLCENPIQTFAEPLVGRGIRDAVEKEFPFVVSIAVPNKHKYVDEKHFCTGTLISRWHVLTAAHCFDGVNYVVVQVTIGSVDLRSGRAFFSDKWITYNQWARRNHIRREHNINDIAIIKLKEEVNEVTIVPAELWKGTNQELYGKAAIVAGWGYTNDVEDTSRILQVANVTIPTNEECTKSRDSCSLRPMNDTIHSRYLCSKADYVLLGPGDSGGPLIYGKNTVIGVNNGKWPRTKVVNPNLSPAVVNKRRINLHSSTTYYMDFIKDILDNHQNCNK